MNDMIFAMLAFILIGLTLNKFIKNQFVKQLIPFMFLLFIAGTMTSCSSEDDKPVIKTESTKKDATNPEIVTDDVVDNTEEESNDQSSEDQDPEEEEGSSEDEQAQEELEEEFENEDPSQDDDNEQAEEEVEEAEEEIDEDDERRDIYVYAKRGDIVITCSDRSGLAEKFQQDFPEGELNVFYTSTSNGVVVRARVVHSKRFNRVFRVPDIRSYFKLRRENPSIRYECRKRIVTHEMTLYRR